MTPMTREYSANSQPARESVIAVVMLVILALSVAAAWWLSGSRQARSSEAASILTEIREKGLEAFLGKTPRPQWFLIYKGDKVVGWHGRILARLPNGRYVALEAQIVYEGQRANGYWEKWSLGPKANVGLYTNGRISITRASAAGLSHDTTIEYDHGMLNVKQFLDRRVVDPRLRGGSDRAPDDYLPKGVFDTAAMLVAKRKTKAQFHTVLNDQPFTGAGSLSTFVFSYGGPADKKKFGPNAKRVRVSLNNASWVYILDKSGKRLAKIFGQGDRVELADTVENVLESYHDAVKIMKIVQARTQSLAVYDVPHPSSPIPRG